jgi:hypothetical protein
LKIVGTQLKRLSVCILVAFFTISVLFVNPLLADASTAQKQSSKPKVKVETLAKGTKYATKLYIIDSGKPGGNSNTAFIVQCVLVFSQKHRNFPLPLVLGIFIHYHPLLSTLFSFTF